jgi:hypothetical protein
MVIMQIPQTWFARSHLLNFIWNLTKFEKHTVVSFVKTENFLGCYAIFHSDSNNCGILQT